MNAAKGVNLSDPIKAVAAAGLFVSLATFQDRPGGANPVPNGMGQIDNTNLVNVVGLVNIPCMLSAHSPFRPDAEAGYRGPENYAEKPKFHLLLNSYYPQILPRFMAVVDGTQYEITPGTVEHDSQHTMTRLALRRYSL